MSQEYDIRESVLCELCGEKLAVLTNHEEYHLAIPRKINLCMGCHLRIHVLPLGDQCFGGRIKVPESSLPFFKKLYANVLSAKGEMVLNGEAIFNARYEVVPDNIWRGGGLERFFADLEKRWEGLL